MAAKNNAPDATPMNDVNAEDEEDVSAEDYYAPYASPPKQQGSYSNVPRPSRWQAPGVNDTATSVVLKRTTPHDVFERWKVSGPLVHEATGLAVLDERTGGGFVHGSRVYILGAPDAGKTALCAQLAHDWARHGIVVGMLAVDEEDDDLLTRLVQRLVVPQPDPLDYMDVDASEPPLRDKFTRQDCEHRDPRVVGEMEQALGALPLAFYDANWTIEAAAADLAAFAKSLTKDGEPPRKSVLFVDSIQAATSAAQQGAAKEPSIREMVNANVKAVRAVASKYRMLVITTGEMNREAYRGIEAGESGDIASGKESGAIEYSARVLVSLRSVKDKPDLVLVRLAKNKQGPAWRGKEDDFHLSLNRATQTLTEAEPPKAAPTKKEALKEEKAKDAEIRKERHEKERLENAQKKEQGVRQRDAEDDAAARLLVASKPDAPLRDLIADLKKLRACGTDRAKDAIKRVKGAS